jgi:hypothetical protein
MFENLKAARKIDKVSRILAPTKKFTYSDIREVNNYSRSILMANLSNEAIANTDEYVLTCIVLVHSIFDGMSTLAEMNAYTELFRIIKDQAMHRRLTRKEANVLESLENRIAEAIKLTSSVEFNPMGLQKKSHSSIYGEIELYITWLDKDTFIQTINMLVEVEDENGDTRQDFMPVDTYTIGRDIYADTYDYHDSEKHEEIIKEMIDFNKRNPKFVPPYAHIKTLYILYPDEIFPDHLPKRNNPILNKV